jgi:hypothetical protein
MALPPSVYEKAQRAARFHVQVEIVEVARKPRPLEGEELSRYYEAVGRAARAREWWDLDGISTVEGRPFARVVARVVRVFRGHGGIRTGESVWFDVRVGEGPGRPGSHQMVFSELLQARYLEVFLDGEPPNCGEVGFLLPVLIATPSAEPVVKIKPPPADFGADEASDDCEPRAGDTWVNLPPPPPRRRWWQFWKK